MREFSTFLIQNGMPENVLSWLLVLPIAITGIVLGRQIVGMKGSGIATPLFLGSVFNVIGLQAGSLILLIMLCASITTRMALQKIRLLYLPKIAVLLIVVITSIIALVPFIPYEKLFRFPEAGFALIVLALSIEPFTAPLLERGPKKVAGILGETFILSFMSFLIIRWDYLRAFVLTYPLLILVGTLTANILIGKWTGLRILEYIRFKDIIFKEK